MLDHYIITGSMILDVREVAYAALDSGRLTVALKGNATPLYFQHADGGQAVYSAIADKLKSLQPTQ